MTDFATAMQLTPVGDQRWVADLPADWAQGRTTFGGLIGALAARVATLVVGADRPLRTLDVAFVAPLPPGPAEVSAEVLGAGKAVTQLVVSFVSGGVLGARVHVVAGASRQSALLATTGPTGMVDGDPADQGVALAYVPGVSPQDMQHFEYRWCSEHFMFTGGGPEAARVNGWARHRTVAPGVEATIAVLDAWPPVILPMAPTLIPVSSVRWSFHLAAPVEEPEQAPEAGLEAQWFWYEARLVQSADGYATAYASMFSDGRLVAWSEQLIAVYDPPVPAGEPDPAAVPVPVPASVPVPVSDGPESPGPLVGPGAPA